MIKKVLIASLLFVAILGCAGIANYNYNKTADLPPPGGNVVVADLAPPGANSTTAVL